MMNRVLFTFIFIMLLILPFTAKTAHRKSFKNSIGMEFVFIKPGTFLMGSPLSEPERFENEKQHQVTLTKGLYLQTTEVTQGQWKAVMGENPSYFTSCGIDCPVENSTWEDCQGFIRKLNQKEETDKYRLPTEAEWEYACRAGTDTPFAFGHCLSSDQANINGNYPMPGCQKGKSRDMTMPVAYFNPNAWDLHDMHGNVWEWCQDWKGVYPSESITDPKGSPNGSERILRGGGWGDMANFCRSAYRYGLDPNFRFVYVGLRLARTQ